MHLNSSHSKPRTTNSNKAQQGLQKEKRIIIIQNACLIINILCRVFVGAYAVTKYLWGYIYNVVILFKNSGFPIKVKKKNEKFLRISLEINWNLDQLYIARIRNDAQKSCLNISDLPSFYEAFISPLFCAMATRRLLPPLRVQCWIACDIWKWKIHCTN
jgi:hypothetical protein